MKKKAAAVYRALICILLAVCVLPLGALKAGALTPSYPVSSSYASGLYYSNLTKVALTGDQREDMVNIALSQVGYKEGSKEHDYSGADDGAYKNYTEYNAWYHDHVGIGMPVGGEGAPWCATFLSWCAAQAGIPRDVIKPSVRASLGIDAFDIDFYSGSDTLNRTADDNEHFKGYNYTPQRGDLFFTRKWTHVGIVVGVNGDTVITVEGNTNDDGSDNGYGVYLHTDRKIEELYFGVPDYAVFTPSAAPGKPTVTTDKTAYTCGEMAGISWDTAADATSYRVEILRDGEQVVSCDLGTTLGYSFAPNVPGSYSVCVIAVNALGTTVSETVSFTASRKDTAISGVSRLAGETRYDTALKAANEIKSSGDRKILRHHRCLRRKLCRFAVSLRCGASHPAGEYGK